MLTPRIFVQLLSAIPGSRAGSEAVGSRLLSLKTISVDLLQFRLKLLRSAHRYTLSSSSSLYAMLLPEIMTYV